MRRALCVRPDDDTFELLRLELLDLGFEVDHAVGASTALGRASAGDYDIYILDNCCLTDGDGISLCREFHRRDSTTPVLFYSGHAFRSEIDEALDAGAHAYITLPDTRGELRGWVEQLVEATETRSRGGFYASDVASAQTVNEHLQRQPTKKS